MARRPRPPAGGGPSTSRHQIMEAQAAVLDAQASGRVLGAVRPALTLTPQRRSARCFASGSGSDRVREASATHNRRRPPSDCRALRVSEDRRATRMPTR